MSSRSESVEAEAQAQVDDVTSVNGVRVARVLCTADSSPGATLLGGEARNVSALFEVTTLEDEDLIVVMDSRGFRAYMKGSELDQALKRAGHRDASSPQEQLEALSSLSAEQVHTTFFETLNGLLQARSHRYQDAFGGTLFAKLAALAAAQEAEGVE